MCLQEKRRLEVEQIYAKDVQEYTKINGLKARLVEGMLGLIEQVEMDKL